MFEHQLVRNSPFHPPFSPNSPIQLISAQFVNPYFPSIFAATSKEGTVKSPLFCFCIMDNKELLMTIMAPKLEELGCFLVDIKSNPSNNSFEVFIDSNKGVTISECEQLSRFLQFNLDRENNFPKDYSLDVSSPGMDNPFKVPQQYDNSIGKTVEVVLLSGAKLEAVLMEYDGERMEVQVIIPPPKKGMKPKTKEAVYEMQEIKSVKKKISF